MKENLMKALRDNEYRTKVCNINKNFKKVLRTVICSGVRNFTAQEQLSGGKNSVYQFYSLNRIVSQNDCEVLVNSSCGDEKLISKRDSLPRFLDTDVGYFGYSSEVETRRPIMVVLTKLNCLTSVDLVSGRWHPGVHLGSQYKFLYLELDFHEEFVYLTSKQYSDQGGSDLIKCVSCFSAAELKPVYHFEVTRSVFGDRVTDVNVNSGVLMVMENGTSITRMYDFQLMLNTNEWFYEQSPLGPKIVVKTLPPPVLVVKSAKCKIMLGARPFHVAFCTDEHSWSIARLDSFDPGKLGEKGNMLAGGALPTFEEDIFSELGFIFHPDTSASVILTGHGLIRCADLVTVDGHLQMTDRYTYDPAADEVFSSDFSVSSSGRRLSRTCVRRDNYVRLHERSYDLSWSYEDELDLIAVIKSEIVPEGSRSTKCLIDSVTIIDAQTGSVVRKVDMQLEYVILKRVTMETAKPQIIFDGLTLSVEFPPKKHRVFRLSEHIDESDDMVLKGKLKSAKSPRKCIKGSRHSARLSERVESVHET